MLQLFASGTVLTVLFDDVNDNSIGSTNYISNNRLCVVGL